MHELQKEYFGVLLILCLVNCNVYDNLLGVGTQKLFNNL